MVGTLPNSQPHSAGDAPSPMRPHRVSQPAHQQPHLHRPSAPMAPPAPRRTATPPSAPFTQLTYDLPQAHIYTSKFYPRSLSSLPSALSEVLIYGHESGLTIFWRARPSATSSKRARRDTDTDDVMALDDTPDARPEQEELVGDNEDKFACSYTIHLGTPVHHIAFPPASILPSDFEARNDDDDDADPLKALPNALLQKNMLIAAACGDRAIRLITLPRAPPPSETPGKKREHVVVLGGGVSGHHDPISAISLSIVPTASDKISPAAPAPASPTASPSFNDPYSPPRFATSKGWDILLSTSSASTTGIILLWRITLLLPARHSPLPVTFKPISRPTSIPLHSPAISLAFNTAPTSLSRRHHLLTADSKGALRILNTHTKTWLCSFYTPFSPTTHRRKKILGAQWCTGGRGIILLTDDGSWGLWDLEGVLSHSDTAEATSYLIGGTVGESWFKPARNTHHLFTDDAISDSPSSRGSAITGTTARRRRLDATTARDGSIGHLCVSPIPGSNFSASLHRGKSSSMGGLQIADEMIAFVFGSTILVLPSLRRFWKVEEAKMARRRGGGWGGGGDEGKGDKEGVVLEGWKTDGAVVTDLDVGVPGRGEEGRARVLLGTGCRVVVVDVREAGEESAVVKSAVKSTRKVPGTPAVLKSGRKGGILTSVKSGESARGKRKVGFL